MDPLSDNTRRALQGHFFHLEELLQKACAACEASSGNGTHRRFRCDLTDRQRTAFVELIDAFERDLDRFSAEWHVDTSNESVDASRVLAVDVQFLGIALEEMSPRRLTGFGPLDQAFVASYEQFLAGLRECLLQMSASLMPHAPGGDGHDP
jgi:hypothetical protein